MSQKELPMNMTIEEIEGVFWPPPAPASTLVLRSHALRKKPLSELTDNEIRTGLTQQIGLEVLVPLALDRLKANPMLDSFYYPGDMLRALFSVPFSFWRNHRDERLVADQVWNAFKNSVQGMDDDWRSTSLTRIEEAYNQYEGLSVETEWLRR